MWKPDEVDAKLKILSSNGQTVKISDIRSTVMIMATRVESLGAQVSQLAEELTNRDDELASANRRIAELETFVRDERDGRLEQARDLIECDARIAELEAKLAQAQARLETVVHCPHCSDQGWYQVLDKWTGEPKQEQCEFCHTVYNSAYNAALRALDEEGDDVEA